MLNDYTDVSDEVRSALSEDRPVVAMETSVVSGGKYPTNFASAQEVDDAIHAAGATPARVALIDGRIKLGLTPEELERLAHENSPRKVGTRDLAVALSTNLTAGTTVSSSIIVAASVGIKVFSVAGIGGVHRGAETSLDISTDLEELARQPIAVVCAGAKSLLDPALTLEYLETKGIPVVGLGTQMFPNYYGVSSGQEVPWTLNSIDEVAKFIGIHLALNLPGGVIVTKPIADDAALAPEILNDAVEVALTQAREQGVRGQALTPVVLSAISASTDGASVHANRAVLVSTAVAAAEIANKLQVGVLSGNHI
ncbi:pseudouridine-5'-phosphate glycosidase [Arthrobacter antibioticus]|uniref:pseudouridine-5'-phosphate glycosidase n=1 Tax=Arthrobacter sp. H35-MC1 TaxID=3046203 RepID=UPI0024BAC3DA|nr:pseudouridine-5'-phosphate glycosidase [Arthrobacter sp. H35-MC1]MDJ0318688.1 pseudouridine-5'-phosphate glycosidase [Arthrobacter sp. H35-MC1]